MNIKYYFLMAQMTLLLFSVKGSKGAELMVIRWAKIEGYRKWSV